MTEAAIELFRSDLGNLIGRDIVYVTATDSERHFDPIDFVVNYAGNLFFRFASAAAGSLGKSLQKSVVKLGKKTADASWKKVTARLSKLAESPPESNNKKQLKKMKQTDRILQDLGDQLADNYLNQFLDAGRKAIEKQLRSDNFPSAKAKKISTAFAKEIEGRIVRPRSKKRAG
jgi:hypothetical protein